jgi:hypothetical protein
MFLNALLLYGTALGSVPIIIHLLNKRRFKPIQWAAMEFLLQAIQKNARRLQLRDLILMLIRALAVACLALALARPAVTMKGIPGAGNSTRAVILLDNSMSMGYNNGRETRFEVAKKMAKAVINQLDTGSRCAVLTFNDDVKKPLGDPTDNLAYLEQEMSNSVQLSDGATNVEKAVAAVQKLFDTDIEYRQGRRELYLITDMQGYPWNPRNVSNDFRTMLKKLSENSNVYLLNAGDGGVDNAAIVSFEATDTLAAVDTAVGFSATVKNFGSTELSALPVDFYVDPTGKDDRPVERATLTVEAGQSGSVRFETKFSTGGDHRVEARIATDDRLSADNRRYCSVEVVQDVQVLLVDGSESHVDDPLINETGKLRSALSPRDPENPDKQNVIATEVIPYHRINEKNLLNYQAVVFANVPRIEKSMAQRLEKQVRAGQGLMIFLGDLVDADSYNSVLGDAGVKLLPAAIKGRWGTVPEIGDKELPPAVSFATEKLFHPIMTDFNSNNDPLGPKMLNAIKVYCGYDMDVPKDDAVRVVAYFSDGKPAIIEKKIGSGVVLAFAMPATTKWSNWPNQYAFIITMIRSINMLALGNHTSRNLPVGATISGNIPVIDQTATVKFTPPPPSVRREMRPELSEGRALFTFTETDRAGFYDVLVDRVPKVSMTYALNSNSEIESNLQSITPENLKQDYPDFNFSFVSKPEDLQTKLQAERQGTELWPWLMFAVFALLASESILANRWAPRD